MLVSIFFGIAATKETKSAATNNNGRYLQDYDDNNQQEKGADLFRQRSKAGIHITLVQQILQKVIISYCNKWYFILLVKQ
jgi:hypothetical protein